MPVPLFIGNILDDQGVFFRLSTRVGESLWPLWREEALLGPPKRLEDFVKGKRDGSW